MTHEQLIANQDISTLWDSLYLFTCQQANRFYKQHNERCQSAGVVLDDLIQQAYVIMCNAVRAYKEGEYKFITYYGKSLLYGYLRLISYNREKPLNNCQSLNKPINSEDSDSNTLIDITPDPNGEEGIDKVIEREYQRGLTRDVQLVLDMLPELEHDVIHERFWNKATFDDISIKHGITRDTARSVEGKALLALRRGKKRAILNKYRQDIINGYGYRGGIELWRNTHTSSTELAVLKLEELL